MRVVATAGHVDHGKSTLVLALTGTDPDRWDEEKRRGLTIDLGFAATTLASGATIGFVDVPGHIRFLKNMLAGVGAVDACLFVVDATEGWKPQSEEHLRILELLGLGHGLVALTKIGLVDDERRELARLDITAHVEGTFLDGAEIVPVDAVTGVGMDALRAALDRLVAATPAAADLGWPRLWIDRSFSAKGAGTIVTGTLAGGRLAVDDELVVLPRRRAVRVRALQSHNHTLAEAGPGRRLAVNLTGIAHHEAERGDVLVRPGQWHETAVVDASLRVLDSLAHEVSRRGAFLLHLGSGELAVQLRVLGPDALAPGATGTVRLHLPVALPLVPGDRFVLRDAGRQQTVGGGEILDVDPVLRASRARPDRSPDRLVRERGVIEHDALMRRTGPARPDGGGAPGPSPNLDRWHVDPPVLEEWRAQVLAQVEAAGMLGFELAQLDEHHRAVAEQLAGEGTITINRGRATAAHAADRFAAHPYLAALDAEPFTPPTPTEFGIDASELRELVGRGLVAQHDGVCFSTAALDAACAALAPRFAEHADGLSVAAIRDALGTSRKYVIPLVTILDRTGRTRRRGDLRIPGPRLLDAAGRAGP